MGIVHRRFFGTVASLVAVLLVVAAALTAVRYTGMDRPRISQNRYHDVGTVSEHADFSETVPRRMVIVEAPERSLAAILGEYVDRVRRGWTLAGVQGEYDPVTREIRILGDEVRLQSRLPEMLRGELYRVVRHEYGHAAFFDWLAARGLTDAQAAAVGLLTREDRTPEVPLPSELVPVVEEWQAGPEYAYADPYLTSNLAEYLAESYARVLDGASVPPEAAAFVREQYDAR